MQKLGYGARASTGGGGRCWEGAERCVLVGQRVRDRCRMRVGGRLRLDGLRGGLVMVLVVALVMLMVVREGRPELLWC